MNLLAAILDAGVRVGTHLAAALGPLWRAWDRLTGRRTATLAWLVLTVSTAAVLARSIAGGDWWSAPIFLVGQVVIAGELHTVSRYPEAKAESVPADSVWARYVLLTIGGITAVLGVPSMVAILASGGSVARGVGFAGNVLACLAGAVDAPGGGKSCIRRAVEWAAGVLGSLAPRPAPAPG